MLFDLFIWWYTKGWISAWRAVPENIKNTSRMFTLPLLLRTLFSPWKQIISLGGRSLNEKLKAMVDNLLSRVIGFLVRVGVLLAACVLIVITGILSLVIAAIWPAVPLAAIYFLYRGIVG